MRCVRVLLLGSVLLAGCKPEPFRPDAAPPWWQPVPDTHENWDIQLTAPIDISATRDMYVLDLWDAVPAPTVLDYGGGVTVMVPAGPNATAIAELHSRAQPAIVVCQVATGAIRLDDPDAPRFPGFEAAPPNRPAPPADDSVIGWSRTMADAQERFVDIRDARVATLMGQRITLAKTIGCDAIAAQHNDMIAYETQDGHGFGTIPFGDYVSWILGLGDRSHDVQVSLGLRNGTTLTIDEISKKVDWLMEDRCGERQDCDMTRPFLAQNKAVFAIEYNQSESGGTPRTQTELNALCNELSIAGSLAGIVKDNALSNAFYMKCP